MRTAFFTALEEIFAKDDKVVLLLGDIGVYTARNLFKDYPDRVFNIGICEQATISLAAGLAKEGFRPIFYTIAPFAVERCLEQIKVDVGYQHLPVTIVSVGASYDYAALGCTHHCPADVELMTTIPGMSVFIPGSGEELRKEFKEQYGYLPLYVRLSEKGHEKKDKYSNWEMVKDGDKGLVIMVGNMLNRVDDICWDIDVEVVYVNKLFASHNAILNYDKIAIIEPFYQGTTARLLETDGDVYSIGIPRWFLTDYGKPEEHDRALALNTESIRVQLKQFFYD